MLFTGRKHAEKNRQRDKKVYLLSPLVKNLTENSILYGQPRNYFRLPQITQITQLGIQNRDRKKRTNKVDQSLYTMILIKKNNQNYVEEIFIQKK